MNWATELADEDNIQTFLGKEIQISLGMLLQILTRIYFYK